MSRRRFTAVFAVLAALTLFFGGMLAYKLVADRAGASGAVAVRSGSGQRDSLTIEGRAVIQVIRNGRVVTTWKGHNALYAYGKNAIAGCVSGQTTAPIGYGSCSGYITHIWLSANATYVGGWIESAPAVNAVTPSGCDPAGYSMCSGWTTSATVTISRDETVTGASAANANTNWFDQILGLNLAVNAGDRVAVTISFTVA